MKITPIGIVRKIDNLGRIIIPIEIREELGFEVGDSFEIFTVEDDGVYFKKYKVDIDLQKSEKIL